jgi:hypothetical protein
MNLLVAHWIALSTCVRRGVFASALSLSLAAAGCSGSGSSDGGGSPNPPPPPSQTTISGRITYTKVPFTPNGNGLDYGAASDVPVRGAVVEAIDSANTTSILASTTTDADGRYSLQVTSGPSVFIRTKAQLLRSGTPSWNIRVLNNTNGNALYALDGAAMTTAGTALTANLNAGSGWNGSGYSAGQRSAAPFSLLDVAYEAVNLVLTADANAVFPPLDMHWSPQNHDSDTFNPAAGEIETTQFTLDAPAGIYVLGQENVDTDEYDQHVIAHEMGHYMQEVFSRDDSPGGPHSPDEKLDLRVAFSEGFGNAFSGMVKGTPNYRDSFGPQQGDDFQINVEQNPSTATGWFSEGSVQSILYDIFDANVDGADNVSLGFGPIFQALRAGSFNGIESFTSIFPFIATIRSGNAAAAPGIDAIVSAQSIVSATADELGTTETNDGGDATNLPIYRAAQLNAAALQACSSTANSDDGNKLGNRRFLRFNVPGNQQVTFRAAGPAGSDPDLTLDREGFIEDSIEDSTATGVEQFSRSLAPGNYVLEVYDSGAVDEDPSTPGNVCMNVTITSP